MLPINRKEVGGERRDTERGFSGAAAGDATAILAADIQELVAGGRDAVLAVDRMEPCQVFGFGVLGESKNGCA